MSTLATSARIRVAHVVDHGSSPWRERRALVFESVGRKGFFVLSSSRKRPDCGEVALEAELEPRESWTRECSRHCTPAPIALSASWRTLCWTCQRTATRIILSRGASKMTPPSLGWQRWLDHKLAVHPLRWFSDLWPRSTGTPLTPAVGFDPDLVHSQHVRSVALGRCGCDEQARQIQSFVDA